MFQAYFFCSPTPISNHPTMKLIRSLVALFLLSFAGHSVGASDSSDESSDAVRRRCTKVRGKLSSTIVMQGDQFLDDTTCQAPAGAFCTQGTFTGRLGGFFKFTGLTLAPYSTIDDSSVLFATIAATTGKLELTPTSFCEGTYVTQDASSFSLQEDGYFAGVQRYDEDLSSGNGRRSCGKIKSGTVITSGIFQSGCVDCQYEGEICF